MLLGQVIASSIVRSRDLSDSRLIIDRWFEGIED